MSKNNRNLDRLLWSRIGALEALLQNLYAKHYTENYTSPPEEALRSLRRAIKKRYHLGSLYGEINHHIRESIEELIIDFFNNNLSIVAAMENAKKHSGPTSLENPVWSDFFSQNHADSDIVEISEVEAPSSDLVRRVWTDDGTQHRESFIIKELGNNDSRNQLVRNYSLFDREICFYKEVAPSQSIPCPRLIHSSSDPAYLILEDLGKYYSGDQEFGYTIPEAKSVIDHVVKFHSFWLNNELLKALPAPRIDNPLITSELPRMLEYIWSEVGNIFRKHAGDNADLYIRYLIENIDDITAALTSNFVTILHGDLRLDNILFEKYHAKYFVDWQMLAIGSPMMDIAYFVSQSGTENCQHEMREYAFDVYENRIYVGAQDTMRREYYNALILNLSTPIFAAYGDLNGNGEVRLIALEAFKRAIKHLQSLQKLD